VILQQRSHRARGCLRRKVRAELSSPIASSPSLLTVVDTHAVRLVVAGIDRSLRGGRDRDEMPLVID
jgi:hypothetical protein